MSAAMPYRAQAALYAKASLAEHGRRMGSAKRQRWTAATAAKMAASVRATFALSPQERDIYLAQKRSLWLTRLIVTHPELGVATLDLEGRLGGVPYAVHLEMPIDASLKDFLLAIMRDSNAPLVMRIDAAITALPLCHRKVRSRVEISELFETLEPLRKAAHG
jgi:hypothetical protein